MKQRISDIGNRLVFAKGEAIGGRMEWEVGVGKCKHLYVGWITSKGLLCSVRTISNIQ